MKRALPSQQCKAKAKRSGEQCKRRVIGATVCRVHGQNSRTKAKRARTIAMAEALRADPRRRPDEVLVDVLHSADYLMRKAREEISANSASVETLQNLLSLTEQAGRWAKTTLDAGVEERQVRLAEKQGELVAGCIRRILEALELNDTQWSKVGTVVPAELRRLSAIEGGRS